MTGGDGGVSEAGDGADAGETIGSAGAQAGPRLNAGEIIRGEGGEELAEAFNDTLKALGVCLLYTSPSPRDATLSRMPSSA